MTKSNTKLLYTYNCSSVLCGLYFGLMMCGLGGFLSSKQLAIGGIIYLLFGSTSLVSFLICKLKSVKTNKWFFAFGPFPVGLFLFVFIIVMLLERIF